MTRCPEKGAQDSFQDINRLCCDDSRHSFFVEDGAIDSDVGSVAYHRHAKQAARHFQSYRRSGAYTVIAG